MGKPATTYFCGNGHLLEDNAHHVYGPRDMRCWSEEVDQVCPHCGSNREFTILEWRDDDYPQSVPTTPIREDEIECKDHRGNTYFKMIPVYDISTLKTRRK